MQKVWGEETIWATLSNSKSLFQASGLNDKGRDRILILQIITLSSVFKDVEEQGADVQKGTDSRH